MPESVGLPIALGLGAVLIVWYLAGNELMRRRAHRLALWSKRVVDPLGGKQTIQWLGGQAFRLEVSGARVPFATVTLTGLVEAWDVPIVWAWNRLRGRRDMVLVQASLRTQPMWGFEVYRPGTVLSGDARHFARHEGWQESSLDELFVAAGGDAARQLATDLVNTLNTERSRLVRLAVRRQGRHLTVALNVPDPGRFEPADALRLTQQLAQKLRED